jgi:SpoVK/Ycf46/Vps4 family AAA+-type ATPase
VLEYYEGLLFLTTNRVDNIDAAFQSRIHISLAYPNLTSVSRKSIWQNFLKSSGGLHEWKDDDLEDLASVELNGRQIKNVLKSASLLAARKKDGLNKKYVDMVLGIEKKRPGVAAGF